MATRSTDAEMGSVSWETMSLLPTPSEGTPTAPVEAGVRATVLSWAPNTTKSYLAGWNDFTRWCFQNRCPGVRGQT